MKIMSNARYEDDLIFERERGMRDAGDVILRIHNLLPKSSIEKRNLLRSVLRELFPTMDIPEAKPRSTRVTSGELAAVTEIPSE